jgi:hypothetical protein
MPLDATPQAAEDFIAFGGDTDPKAATLNYSVPLPGHYRGRRMVILDDLPIDDDDWLPEAKGGNDYADAIGLKQLPDGTWDYDEARAIAFWISQAAAAGVPGDQLAEVQRLLASLSATDILATGAGGSIQEPESDQGEGIEAPSQARFYRSRLAEASLRARLGAIVDRPFAAEPTDIPSIVEPSQVQEQVPDAVLGLVSFLNSLTRGVIELPVAGYGGTYEVIRIEVVEQAVEPQLFLVELYGITSFLGDYGLGRTVKTFSLLPGEETTITFKTWRSSEAKEVEASSIVDSFQKSSAAKFQTAAHRETTDKATEASATKWHVEAEAGASIGFAHGKVSGGAAGEYRNGQETFTKQVADVVEDHANEASAKREMSVTATAELTQRTAEESAVERRIRNVNLRRTLNFVFRELNQRYETKVHLIETRVAFANGLPDAYREVPLSGLRGLLADLLNPDKRDEVAQALLRAVSVVVDLDDQPVTTLEEFRLKDSGQDWTIADAKVDPVSGEFEPPSETLIYRFKRGALGSNGHGENPIEGVVMDTRDIVMRTDSIVVEALLGQADALDPYAMETQRAEAEAKTLRNEREQLAHEDLEAIADPVQRAEAFKEMFNENDELLRVALVEDGGGE